MEQIKSFLADRKNNGLLRFLRPAGFRGDGRICINGKNLYDFSSNDYLGLSQHPKLKAAVTKAVEKYGVGSSASRLLSGSLDIHSELEEKVALFKGKENALVFNSGYQANVGIISAICKSGDAVFCDKLSHASIIDGALLSRARLFRFRHNDINHLDQLLKKTSGNYKNRLIITESVFSMDGDIAPLKEMVEIKENHNCRIMVDEAHATGIFGDNGSGVVTEMGLQDGCEFIMGTFSKAMGAFGGYLACSNEMREYLVNVCRSFIYSTSLPAAVIAANIAALEIINQEADRREILLENASYLRNELIKLGLKISSRSQIIPVVIGDVEKTISASKDLEEKGFLVPAIRPPTVQPGRSRLRLSVTYHHKKEVLQNLLKELEKIIHV